MLYLDNSPFLGFPEKRNKALKGDLLDGPVRPSQERSTRMCVLDETSLKVPIKLLLVEDDFDFSNILKLGLRASREAFFDIQTAASFLEAFQLLGTKSFDLVLLDLELPDSHGIETFENLQVAAPQVPFVILSGVDDENLALTAVKKGAQDYVVKGSADRKILVRILKYAMERHEQKKQVQELNERLEKLSFLDPLTQLLNRRGLQRVLSRELHISGREGSNLVVILLDLDNFKPINDTFGHAVGDIVLQEIAKVLKNTARATDYVSRVGGDEFIILLPNTRPAEATLFSERIRLAINRNPLVSSGGHIVKTTASLGVVNVTHPSLSIEKLLEETHAALAKSKRLGKNRVSFGDAPGNNPGDVVETLKAGKCFLAVKQPILDLQEEKMVGYEFLSRTNIPGFEMPDEFLNFSIENNILTMVDHRCLEVSMAASYGVPAACEKHVNLFPSTMAGLQPEWFERLFPPGNLCGNYFVEISEQQILGDPSYLLSVVGQMKKRGVRVAIDDLGFGRSSLESLIVLQPDVIKIDKKLVKGVSRDRGRREMLRRLLNVVSSLNARIIAEGIEDRQDLETVKALGVQYGQGFLWGVPA